MPRQTADLPTLALTRELIARSSVTPEDAGCLEVIAARLAPLGFVCERIDGGGVSNLWARRGTQSPLVVFAGHTDVVPHRTAGRLALRSLRAHRT